MTKELNLIDGVYFYMMNQFYRVSLFLPTRAAKNRDSLRLESKKIKIDKNDKNRFCVKSHVNNGFHHSLFCRTLVFYHMVHINICNIAIVLTTPDSDHVV